MPLKNHNLFTLIELFQLKYRAHTLIRNGIIKMILYLVIAQILISFPLSANRFFVSSKVPNSVGYEPLFFSLFMLDVFWHC